jgi:hypothetical protein
MRQKPRRLGFRKLLKELDASSPVSRGRKDRFIISDRTVVRYGEFRAS